MIKIGCALIGLFFVMPCLGQTHSPRTLGYVLQAEHLAKTRTAVVNRLAKCNRDWIILDTHFDGDPWPPEAIKNIRQGKSRRKVLAYLSIGEAEDYRNYWQNNWDANHDGKPDSGAPNFLCKLNLDWEGNYKVRYWQAAWQQIILRRVTEIISVQKFDGLYLDLVDAFEFFEHDPKTDQWHDHRINPQTKNTYRKDMIQWVKKIKTVTHQHNRKALIVPQNGVQLLAETDYCQLIDAVGVEDLFTQTNQLQTKKHTNFFLKQIKPLQKLDKPVWLIEYPTAYVRKKEVIRKSQKQSLRLLITDRDLKTLGQSY